MVIAMAEIFENRARTRVGYETIVCSLESCMRFRLVLDHLMIEHGPIEQ